MVAELARRGSVSSRVLDAVARVPRERFAPRFWTWGDGQAVRAWSVDDQADPAAVAARLYTADRALALHPFDHHSKIVSTASAPRLVAAMLDALDVEPGMRVLEIGTGSGYNAALLCELTGDPALVTTVDIDAGLVEAAAERLPAAGYAGVHVIAHDASAGRYPTGPYDRVVATVGCRDLVPEWFEQLAPGGFALVPVEHGWAQPTVRASVGAAGMIESVVVVRSHFVPMQGGQAAGDSPWPHQRALDLARANRSKWDHAPLPEQLAAALGDEPGGLFASQQAWDFGYFLALADRRVAGLGALADGAGSGASLDPAAGRVLFAGPSGRVLADDLVARAEEWAALGLPAAADFASAWHRLPTDAAGRWAIDRLAYRQVVELNSVS